MSRLSRVIAPLLREYGLEVQLYPTEGAEPRELLVRNPRFPSWGRIVIDREGLMEWDLQGDIRTDEGARQIAALIALILASTQSDSADRYGALPHWQPPGEADRPHP